MFNRNPVPRNAEEGRTRVREFKAMGVDGTTGIEHWYGIPDAAIEGGLQNFPAT
jgi:hypothetical protein